MVLSKKCRVENAIIYSHSRAPIPKKLLRAVQVDHPDSDDQARIQRLNFDDVFAVNFAASERVLGEPPATTQCTAFLILAGTVVRVFFACHGHATERQRHWCWRARKNRVRLLNLNKPERKELLSCDVQSIE